ncbi:MAG TPA: MFS transporter [Asanoa sp.]
MRMVLRLPAFRLLFGGLVASMVAESIMILSLAIWVKDLTGSNGLTGLTIVAVAATSVVAPLIGWVVDRFRRRPFLVGANLTVAVALIPLFAVRDRNDVWVIFVVAALYGLSYIAVSAALNGLIKEVVPAVLLPDANGALQSVKQGLRIGGPLAGAGLYTAVGGWTLAVVGQVGFLLAAAAIALIRVPEERPGVARTPWLSEVGAGLRHVAGHPVLRQITFGVALAVFLLGFNETLVFAYVDDGLRRPAAFVGVLTTAQASGGLLGGLVAASLVRRLGELGALTLGMLALFPASFSFLVARLWVAFPGVAVFGAAVSVVFVAFNTMLQRRTPAGLMGRVTAATDALISGPVTVAIMAGAAAVSVVDYRLLFAATGTGLLVIGFVVSRAGARRPFDGQHDAPDLGVDNPPIGEASPA